MHFEKVSFEEWKRALKSIWENDLSEETIIKTYNNIVLPKRGSQFAAGYDFYCPIPTHIDRGPLMIPTGIRWVTDENDRDKVLIICPRSGLGTKYGLKLANTIGVVDSDYCLATNEGHIMASLTTQIGLKIDAGDRFIQGVILPYYTCGETVEAKREGGFGSTGVK